MNIAESRDSIYTKRTWETPKVEPVPIASDDNVPVPETSIGPIGTAS